MKINIYDKNLNRILAVGDRFVSCLWAEGYNSVQPFTLELQDTKEVREKVAVDFYVGRADRNTLMVIKSVEFSNNKIVLSGKQASRVLDDVAFVGTMAENKDIESSIISAYDGSSKFPLVEFKNNGLGVKYKSQLSHKSILELCEIMSQEEDVGFRALRDGGKIVVEFYKPKENPNLIFSTKYKNLTVKSVLSSTEQLKNYAIVLGEGEGENRKKAYVDVTNGEQRRELIVDAKDISKEEDETDDQYLERLRARGIEKLLSNKVVFDCAFVPSTGDFGSRFDLGDVLTLNIPEHGIKAKARVIRFSQKEQNNKTDTIIEVGQMTFKR